MTRQNHPTQTGMKRLIRTVHRTAIPDRHHELQLLREIAIINKKTLTDLGAPNTITEATPPKRKPDLPDKDSHAHGSTCDPTDNEKVKLKYAAAATMLIGATSGCTEALEPIQASTRNMAESGSIYSKTTGRIHAKSAIKDGELIAKFSSHSFSSYCFETLKCRVLYKDRYDTDQESPSITLTEDIRVNLSAGWAIFDKPSRATIKWTSKDGTEHFEHIELGKIFESGLIMHAKDLNVADVNLGRTHDKPDIILVVNDRSVSVYMKAWISLKRPIDPNNRFTDFRNDLILAYSQSY